ncbi:uncharacterized protein LOC128883022 [Hylaeus volcanicus]|uniref:uncharacterized protein LOC128883022 n=1 Tax=Hylaeus volcanicus TaxID=313075 RepID=UPI0023B7F59E|nr:uncharacterized protein LOC128883022 [Hylaeus volcanicus]
MALDSVSGLEKLPIFFPKFAREHILTEHEYTLNLLWSHLESCPKSICEDNRKFTTLIRLATILPSTALVSFDALSYLLVALWNLYCEKNITYSQKQALTPILTTRLKALKTTYCPQSWMSLTARSSFVAEEKIRHLGTQLHWRPLFTMLHERFTNRGYRDIVDINCDIRKSHINLIFSLVSSCRFLWNSNEVASELIKILNFDFATTRSVFDLTYSSRMLSLFVGKEFWHRKVLEGDILKWWLPLCDRNDSMWDTLFCKVLYNAVRYGWAKGNPLFDACFPIRRFLFQLLTTSLCYPVVTKRAISFSKIPVIAELLQLSSKQQYAYSILAKIVVLLLEPIDGPQIVTSDNCHVIPMAESQPYDEAFSRTNDPSIWDLLETFLSVLFPLTHPNNLEAYTIPISRFVSSFIISYTRRVSRERMTDSVVDYKVGRCRRMDVIKSYRLGQKEDKKIVSLFLPLVLQGIYSKSSNASSAFEYAMKHLCYLHPSSTLPIVTDQILSALATLTDSHRIQSALRLLIHLCPLILQRMPELIPDMLSLTLPALDTSDPFKTVQVLTFYIIFFSHMKATDISHLDTESIQIGFFLSKMKDSFYSLSNQVSPFVNVLRYPKETIPKKVYLKDETDDNSKQFSTEQHQGSWDDPQLFWTEENTKLRLSSIIRASFYMPVWIHDFFNQILELASHSLKIEKKAKSTMSSVDRSLFVAAKFCLTQVLCSCNENACITICQVFRDWIIQNLFPDAINMTAFICRSFSQSHPTLALRILLQPICDKILQFHLNHPNVSIIVSNSREEKSLMWFMKCLSNLLRVGGGHLYKYRSDIVTIIAWSFQQTNKTIFRLGLKILCRTIESCTTISINPQCLLSSETLSETELIDSLLKIGLPWWRDYQTLLEDIARSPVKDNLHGLNDSDTGTIFPNINWFFPSMDDLKFCEYLIGLSLYYAKRLLSSSLQKFDEEECCVYYTNQESETSTELDLQNLSNELSLPTFCNLFATCQIFTQLDRLSLERVLSIGRHVLKSLGSTYPDERVNDSPSLPIISPYAKNLSLSVSEFLATACFSISRIYLGLKVNTDHTTIQSIPPLVEMRGTEDGVLMRKLLKAGHQVLSRKGCYWSINAQASVTNRLWNTLNSYTSVCTGIHHLSENQDFSILVFIERLLRQWGLRTDLRTSQHPFTGYRQDLLMLVARLANHFYSENRVSAQHILKNTLRQHYGAKCHIMHMLLKDLRDALDSLKLHQQASEAPASSNHTKQALQKPALPQISHSCPQLITSAGESRVMMNQESYGYPSLDYNDLNEIELELCYARITGVVYVLTCPAMLKRIWRTPVLLKNCMLAICDCFKAAITRPSLQTRLYTLAHSVVYAREPVVCTAEDYQTHIVEGLILKLVDNLLTHALGNWTYQLVATTFLIAISSPFPKNAEEKYSQWLLAACNSSKYFPLLNTVALYSLTIYLHSKMALSTSSTTTNNFPKSVLSTLAAPGTIHILMEALVHAHHETCGSTSASYPETVYQLILDILNLDTTWPISEFPRESRYFCLHNSLTVSTLVRFQKTFLTTETLTYHLDQWKQSLHYFLQFPIGEKEYYVACCEIVGGILNAANEWDQESFIFTWQYLHPELSRIFYALDQEVFLDFLDAMRFATDFSVLKQDHIRFVLNESERFKPLVNFLLYLDNSNINNEPIQQTIKQFDLLSSMSSNRSSLETTKRLKLMLLIIKQCSSEAVFLIQTLIPSIPQLIIYPYNQMRIEIAKCLGFIYTKICDMSHGHDSQLVHQLNTVIMDVGEKYIQGLRQTSFEQVHGDITTQRSEDFIGTETLMLSTTIFFQSLLGLDVPSCISGLIPLFFESVKHPDIKLNDISRTTLTYIAVRSGAESLPFDGLLDSSVGHSTSEIFKGFLKALKDCAQASSWKLRRSAIEFLQIFLNQYRMKLCFTETFNQLVDICIERLTDCQSEVREVAQRTLSNFALSMSSSTCRTYAQHFLQLALKCDSGDPKKIGGVLGLSALIQSAPYHIPDWLPSTIVQLAQLGGSKSDDIVRRQVEKTLQEFFRTHCDAWNELHVKKFSSAQLNILNIYKGRPRYFS